MGVARQAMVPSACIICRTFPRHMLLIVVDGSVNSQLCQLILDLYIVLCILAVVLKSQSQGTS